MQRIETDGINSVQYLQYYTVSALQQDASWTAAQKRNLVAISIGSLPNGQVRRRNY